MTMSSVHTDVGRPRDKLNDFLSFWHRRKGPGEGTGMATITGTAGNGSDDRDTFRRKDFKVEKMQCGFDKENEEINRKRKEKGKESSFKSKLGLRQGKGEKPAHRTGFMDVAPRNRTWLPATLDLGPHTPLGLPVEDIVDYLKEREKPLAFADLLEHQVQVSDRVRGILVDWLIQVQHYLAVGTNTLHLAVTLLNLCLSKSEISLGDVQLLGITCLLIAAKFHERFAPEIQKLIRLTDHTYTYRDVVLMEIKVLTSLGFVVNYPTPEDFLKVYLSLVDPCDQLENLTRYLIDLSLVDSFCTEFKPSHLTAGAIYTAKRLIQAANDAAFSSTTTILTPTRAIGRGQRRHSRRGIGSGRMRERSVKSTEITSDKRRMSYTVSETTTSRRISVVVDSGDGRRLSIMMDDDKMVGKRRVSVTAMDCDEDVFSCESTIWNDHLDRCTDYDEQDLIPVAHRLTSLLQGIETSKLQGARKKFSSKKKFNAISDWSGLKRHALETDLLPALCRNLSIKDKEFSGACRTALSNAELMDEEYY